MFVLQLIWLIKGILFYPDEAPRDLDEQMFTDFTKLLIGHTDKFIKIFMSFEILNWNSRIAKTYYDSLVKF